MLMFVSFTFIKYVLRFLFLHYVSKFLHNVLGNNVEAWELVCFPPSALFSDIMFDIILENNLLYSCIFVQNITIFCGFLIHCLQVSTNILRKYSGPLDIWLSIIHAMQHSGEVMHCLLNEHPQKSFLAMAQHSSQWVWYLFFPFFPLKVREDLSC